MPPATFSPPATTWPNGCAGTLPSTRAAGSEVRTIDHAPYRWHDGLKAAVGVSGNDMDALGLAWIISLPKANRPLIMAKSGGFAGFMTYVVLAPTRGAGVFVAVNRLNFPMFEGLMNGANSLITDLARASSEAR